MGDWRNACIHIDTDGGGAKMDIRYDSGAVDFSINGNNEFTMAKEDALILIKALTEEIVKGEDVCPYCGHTEHEYEEDSDEGYDDELNYYDEAWFTCKKCGEYFLKRETYVPFRVEVGKEEDVLGGN